MIRIIIALIGLFFGLWFENNSEKPKSNIVNVADLSSCGISASHSYRSNFDFQWCVQNNASMGHVKRLGFSIVASNCGEPGDCNELQRVQRDLSVDLPAGESRQIKQNLSFSDVDVSLSGIQWSVEIHSTKAHK